MKWFALIVQLLPSIVMGVENVGKHLSGREKKQAAQDALTALASGVGVVAPQHAQAATDAAQTAVGAIDGVVKVLNDVGVLTHKSAAPAKA